MIGLCAWIRNRVEKQLKTLVELNSATKSKKYLQYPEGQGYEDLKNRFSNPGLFEGTKPIPDGKGKGPLSGISPGDSGIDISAIPGASNWAAIAAGKKR